MSFSDVVVFVVCRIHQTVSFSIGRPKQRVYTRVWIISEMIKIEYVVCSLGICVIFTDLKTVYIYIYVCVHVGCFSGNGKVIPRVSPMSLILKALNIAYGAIRARSSYNELHCILADSTPGSMSRRWQDGVLSLGRRFTKLSGFCNIALKP